MPFQDNEKKKLLKYTLGNTLATSRPRSGKIKQGWAH